MCELQNSQKTSGTVITASDLSPYSSNSVSLNVVEVFDAFLSTLTQNLNQLKTETVMPLSLGKMTRVRKTNVMQHFSSSGSFVCVYLCVCVRQRDTCGSTLNA